MSQRLARIVLILGCTLGAVAVAVPALGPAIYMVGATIFVVAAVFRIPHFERARRTPWVSLTVGVGLLLTSGIVRSLDAWRTGGQAPFPSIADVASYPGYLAIILSMRQFIRAHGHRHPRWRREAAIDGLIVGAAVAVAIFASILVDYVEDSEVEATARAANVAYSFLTVALVGHVATLAVGSGVRNQSWRLLAVAASSIVISDLMLLLDTAGSGWAEPLAAAVASIAFGAGSAAVLHEDAARMGQTAAVEKPGLSTGRLTMLGLALLIVPISLLVSFARGTDPDLRVVFAGALALSGLSLYRIWLLFAANERVAEHEATLRDSSPALVSATRIEEALAVAASAAASIAGPAATVTTRHSGAAPPGAMTIGADNAFVDIVFDEPLDDPQTIALRALDAQLGSAVRGIAIRDSEMRDRLSRRLRALVAQSSDVALVVDGSGRISYVSPNSRKVLGRSAESLLGTDPTQLAHPDDVQSVAGRVASASERATPSSEARLSTGEGAYRWFALSARDFRSDPEVDGVVLTARDVTEERAAKLGLQRSEQWFRGLVQNSSDVIAVVDEEGLFTYVSPASETLIGLRPEQLRGHNFLEVLAPEDLDGLAEARRALGGSSHAYQTLELVLERADGGRRTAEVTVTDLRDDPSVRGLVLNIRDVTDRKRLEEDLRHQVLHDDLTGLGSRVQFTTQLHDALSENRRPGSLIAALFIDLDDFKNINDSLGHAAGDQVLVEISSRLLGRLRLHDRAARFGGDEFAVLLTDVYSDSDVTLVADRIVEELSRPVELHGQEVRLSVSVGIAIDDDGSQSPEDLLRAADVAMYEAKAQGKGRWAIFQAEMAHETLERFEISNSLGAAIKNDELMVHYQPILDLSSGRTAGVEALVRWQHPIRGMVSPGAFIPLAERNGLIVPLGRRVLETAVRQVSIWRSEGHDIYASVNISPVQLQRDGIVDEVLEIVHGASMDPQAVVLELTESALINDFALVVERIDALRAAGLRVAIDDFGTGYATLRYADEFSADILKIDQSFVARLETQDDSTIISTVLAIAHDMGAETVAEGIEVPDQHRRLLGLGCRLGQGYYFARPAPADAISQILTRELDGEALAGHAH